MLFFPKKEKAKEPSEVEEDEFGIEKTPDISNLDDFLDTTSIQGIYPFSWEEFPDHIESGDNYIRVLAIIDYPKIKKGNWLAELKRKKGNITIIQDFESSNARQMVEYYNKTIKNKEAEKIDTYDPLKKKKLEQAIKTANMQLSKYLESEVTYLYQHMYLCRQKVWKN